MGWWNRFTEDMGDVFADMEEEFNEDEQDEILEGDDDEAADAAAERLLEGSIETLFNPGSYGE